MGAIPEVNRKSFIGRKVLYVRGIMICETGSGIEVADMVKKVRYMTLIMPHVTPEVDCVSLHALPGLPTLAALPVIPTLPPYSLYGDKLMFRCTSLKRYCKICN